VGGSAQPKAMKKVAGRLRLDLAQFRELEAFAAFGSDLDAASKAQLERGSRLVELLKQPQYQPFPMEEEVVSVWSGTTGKLDEVPLEDIKRFEREFLDFLKRDNPAVLDTIRSTTDLSDDTVRLLEDAVTKFKGQFTTSAGAVLHVNEPAAAALDEAEVQHATITKVKG
jgi:F-type H+-transporting ATPase subunit alpha